MTDALQPQDVFAPSNTPPVEPISEAEIAALQYADFIDHLNEVAAEFDADADADRAKQEAAMAEQDAREGAALTRVLNRLGFPISDLPHNIYIAPDGVAFSLSERNDIMYVVCPIEKQTPDCFFLRVAFWHDPTDNPDDRIYASRVVGSYHSLTSQQIRMVQAQIPAAIETIKMDVLNKSVAFVNAQKAAVQPVVGVAATKPITEFKTVDQGWSGDASRFAADAELEDVSREGWEIVNISVLIDSWTDTWSGDYPEHESYMHRVVTLTRQVAAEAVS